MWISGGYFVPVNLEAFELIELVDLLYDGGNSFSLTCHFVDMLYFLFQVGE